MPALLSHLFVSEVKAELKKQSSATPQLVTDKDIALLPYPIQQYLWYCGFVGKPLMTNAKIIWKEAFLKQSPDKEWLPIQCYQYNFSMPQPTRIVYMKSNLFGLIPFEGRDKYQDGQGNMMIRLMKFFTIGNASGKEMDASALVTLLAELPMLPAYVLQPYIHWTQIDATSAGATIRHNGHKASGIFYFDERGAFTHFKTSDRYMAVKKKYSKTDWTASAANYHQMNGFRLPTEVEGTWHTTKGDFTYFKGKIKNVVFDVKEASL